MLMTIDNMIEDSEENAPIYSTTQPASKPKKRLGKLQTIVGGAAIGLAAFLSACSSPVTPPPPPPPNKVKVYATLTAKDCFTGITIPTGQVSYQPPTGSPVTKNLGEQAYLGEINPNTTMDVDITVTVGGYLKRVFNDVALSGTKSLDTTLLNLNGFNLDGYTSYFLDQCGNAASGWQNMIWDQPSVKVYFNPDPSTGERLPTDFITATEAAVNEIVSYSRGFINSVSFDENGTKPLDTTVPPNGEIWVYRRSDTTGIQNVTYPVGGDVVKASKIWYNVPTTIIEQIRAEVMDTTIQNNQNIFQENDVAKFFEFSLKHRPKGSAMSYRIFLDREQQTGFDGTVTASATVYSQSLSDDPNDFLGDSVTSGSYSSPYSPPSMSDRRNAAAEKSAHAGRNKAGTSAATGKIIK
jgi:hypothetical protein